MLNRLGLLCCIGALALVGAPMARAGQEQPKTEESPARTWLVPSGQGAATYQSIPLVGRRDRDTDSFAADIAAEVARAVSVTNVPPLVRDSRLDSVARDLARWAAAHPLPSFEVVAFLQAHYGIVEQPGPNLILVRSLDERGVLSELRAQLRGSLTRQASRRWGVGISRSASGMAVLLALQDQQLELGPVSRRMAVQGTLTFSGRLLGKFIDPELLVTVPSGAVRRQKLPYRENRFEARMACDAGAGKYQVEIGGTDRGGPAVLANFPVYCGAEPPDRVQVVVSNAVVQSTRQKPEDVERDLVGLINRARASANLRPLVFDPRLAQVARSHSIEMGKTGRVEHVSARSGSAVDRLKAAHVEPMPSVVAENVGQDYSAAQIHSGFMSSPGHRGNVLNQDVTHVGIGATAGPNGSVFVTELFVAWK